MIAPPENWTAATVNTNLSAFTQCQPHHRLARVGYVACPASCRTIHGAGAVRDPKAVEIGATAGSLLAEIHQWLPCGEHRIAPESASININQEKTWHYISERSAPRHQQLQ